MQVRPLPALRLGIGLQAVVALVVHWLVYDWATIRGTAQVTVDEIRSAQKDGCERFWKSSTTKSDFEDLLFVTIQWTMAVMNQTTFGCCFFDSSIAVASTSEANKTNFAK